MKYTRFTNCHLCDKGRIFKCTDLYVNNELGKIVDKPGDSENILTEDLSGNILAPGFLDIQNNGLFGFNFTEGKAGESTDDMYRFSLFYKDSLAKYLALGVTSICPTVTTTKPDIYSSVIPMYKPTRTTEHCDCLGAHLEGPFINPCKKGCHPENAIIDAKGGYKKISEVYGEENLKKNTRIVTLSPDTPGVLESIPLLVKDDVVVSIGHTDSDHITALKALSKGATMVTHLYNAMPQPHHRETGVVGLITSPEADETPFFGMITDGIHVSPSMASLAYRGNPEKCIVVSDAMHLIGLPDGLYEFDERAIEKIGTRLYIKGTTTLAGAATPLPQCMRNLMHWTGISLANAVKAATNTPAIAINVADKKGFLNKGCDADLVVLNEDGYVQKIYKLGKLVKSNAENNSAKLSAAL